MKDSEAVPQKRSEPTTGKYESILTAALSLFVTRGYYGTAVPAVAREAKVAAGTIYHHFKNKDALVNTLFRKWKLAIAERIYTKFPTGAEPREQFRSMWMEMAAFALEHPRAFAFIELHHHASYLDDESRAVDASLKAFGVKFVERAQELKALKPMPAILLMELMFGAFNGMIRAHWEGRIVLDDDTIAAAEAACWDAVRLIPPN